MTFEIPYISQTQAQD